MFSGVKRKTTQQPPPIQQQYQTTQHHQQQPRPEQVPEKPKGGAVASDNKQAAEAERKRLIEQAAIKRYASGTVFPGTSYHLEKTIGKGSYGRVKLATDLRTGERLAIKFIAKASMTKPAHWTRIQREINIMSLSSHPHIIRLHEWKETEEDVMIVMDFVPGKDLFERINDKKEKRYGEAEARAVFRQILSALDYCHQNRIVHRDLKPENVMVDERGGVKLIDFGFANMYHPRQHLSTNCGSPLYAAPEIVQAKPYIGPEVDIWSLGVVLYAMLVGALPFEDENLKGLYKKIGEGAFTFPDHVSPGARDLISGMLRVNTHERMTICQIRTMPWVCQDAKFPPESFLPIRPSSMARLEPRLETLQMMASYGFGGALDGLTMEEVRGRVVGQPDSPEFAIYWMCEERLRRQAKLQRAQESLKMAVTPLPSFQEPRDLLAQSSSETVKTIPIVPLRSTRKIPIAQPPTQQLVDVGPASYTTTTTSHNYYYPAELATPKYLDMPHIGESIPSIPTTPQKQAPQQTNHHQHSGMMAQAAANVVNKFRKFREMKFGALKPSSNLQQTGASDSGRTDIVHI